MTGGAVWPIQLTSSTTTYQIWSQSESDDATVFTLNGEAEDGTLYRTDAEGRFRVVESKHTAPTA